MRQSPIKLTTDNALPLVHPANLLSIDYPLNQSYPGSFIGHDPTHGNFELSGPFPLIRFKNRQYKLMRVHIHLKSEHIVNADHPSDYEVHFIHVPETGTLDDPKVVIGILYRESEKGPSQRGLNEFIKRLPTKVQLREFSQSTQQATHPITPSKFFPLLPDGTTPDLQNWFYYEGSLTSFPFSEDVSWFVMKNEALVLPSETHDLEQYAEQDPRELQPLKSRIVVRSFS